MRLGWLKMQKSMLNLFYYRIKTTNMLEFQVNLKYINVKIIIYLFSGVFEVNLVLLNPFLNAPLRLHQTEP